ncbi:MAG: hypothetical protein RLZZ15_3260, partial [Verrucomicrobiota bacterium]
MPWVVDTCLVIDLLDGREPFGLAAAHFLEAHLADGLIVCPITFVELAPAFDGDLTVQRKFLTDSGLRHDEDWQPADTLAAHAAWHRVIRRRRAGHGGRRPVADV